MMNQSLGSTILMVTHDPVVGSYANRVLFLKRRQNMERSESGTAEETGILPGDRICYSGAGR